MKMHTDITTRYCKVPIKNTIYWCFFILYYNWSCTIIKYTEEKRTSHDTRVIKRREDGRFGLSKISGAMEKAFEATGTRIY